jgi:hypothetical protein
MMIAYYMSSTLNINTSEQAERAFFTSYDSTHSANLTIREPNKAVFERNILVAVRVYILYITVYERNILVIYILVQQ